MIFANKFKRCLNTNLPLPSRMPAVSLLQCRCRVVVVNVRACSSAESVECISLEAKGRANPNVPFVCVAGHLPSFTLDFSLR